jgi:hypothetical protein
MLWMQGLIIQEMYCLNHVLKLYSVCLHQKVSECPTALANLGASLFVMPNMNWQESRNRQAQHRLGPLLQYYYQLQYMKGFITSIKRDNFECTCILIKLHTNTTLPKVCGHLLVEHLIPKSWTLIWSWSPLCCYSSLQSSGKAFN